jgi:hypothetical protein
MSKGPQPSPEALAWLRAHPDFIGRSVETIAKALKHAGIYSQATYWRDIRVNRLLQLLAEEQSMVKGKEPRPQPEYPDETPSLRKGYYTVVAYFGDYCVDHQPHWGAEWPTKASAIAEADRRYDWMRRTWLPKNWAPKGQELGTDDWCVFVFESTDEVGERPVYARGTPGCTEG